MTAPSTRPSLTPTQERLVRAVWAFDAQAAVRALEAGADPNGPMPGSAVPAADWVVPLVQVQKQCTPRQYAASTALMQALLAHGALPDGIQAPRTGKPLFTAVQFAQPEWVRLLLAHGASLEPPGAMRRLPSHLGTMVLFQYSTDLQEPLPLLQARMVDTLQALAEGGEDLTASDANGQLFWEGALRELRLEQLRALMVVTPPTPEHAPRIAQGIQRLVIQSGLDSADGPLFAACTALLLPILPGLLEGHPERIATREVLAETRQALTHWRASVPRRTADDSWEVAIALLDATEVALALELPAAPPTPARHRL